jgi:hypothetical protein
MPRVMLWPSEEGALDLLRHGFGIGVGFDLDIKIARRVDSADDGGQAGPAHLHIFTGQGLIILQHADHLHLVRGGWLVNRADLQLDQGQLTRRQVNLLQK